LLKRKSIIIFTGLVCGALLLVYLTINFLKLNAQKNEILIQSDFVTTEVQLHNIVTHVDNSKTQDFKNWRLQCDKNTKACQIFQSLKVEQQLPSGEKRKAFALSVFIYLNKENETFIRFVTPLMLDLQAGMIMKVDDGNEFKLPFHYCGIGGCQTDFIIGDDVLKDMQTGETMRVAYRLPNIENLVVLGVSLEGITKAYKALKKNAI